MSSFLLFWFPCVFFYYYYLLHPATEEGTTETVAGIERDYKIREDDRGDPARRERGGS
jgi:hypothetical protein